MENIYEIIGKLLAAVVVALIAYMAPKFKSWLEANTDSATEESILRMVRAFARAAEQLLHDADPTGQQRKQFVLNQLQEMGVEITEAVINMIEGAVWEINTENKKAQVLPVALDGLVIEKSVEVEEPVEVEEAGNE